VAYAGLALGETVTCRLEGTMISVTTPVWEVIVLVVVVVAVMVVVLGLGGDVRLGGVWGWYEGWGKLTSPRGSL